MHEDKELFDKLNLSVYEIVFYRALVENEASVHELGYHALRNLAIELTVQLRNSATLDWQKRDSVRARMRNLVCRLLRRRPYPLETMFRIHCMQQWYSLGDEATEDALYEIASMRQFARLSLDKAIPDRTSIMNFRHMLEKHKLTRKSFKTVNQWLSDCGVMMTQGTLVDATIIEAPSSTKNKNNERDPDMHQTRKGNEWYFGMKAHIGVDANSGLTHTLVTTAANEHDLNQLNKLLHGEEEFVSGDAGYQGAEKREELEDADVEWLIAERPSKVRALKKHPRKNKTAIRIEYLKASIRAKVEHPFRIIKCQFGFIKTRYKGLMKNDSQLAMLFALANLFKVDQMLRRQPRSV
ncbi:transposase [Vibrio vulnificus YJ016]|uniref:Transposase n=1 Tax=Vibrio vulnificus (strain YJ016) TaxID=196600 RepID=Q7MP33_VIBVY|nr:IS5 family transposase [Vibrio vulnificus]BAC93295.1 transposase [Vibrio vulnificus YJ016]